MRRRCWYPASASAGSDACRSRRQPIDTVEVVAGWTFIDSLEGRRLGVTAKGRTSHDGARLGRRLLDHAHRQTVQHAEAVHRSLDGIAVGGEGIWHAFIDDQYCSALTNQPP